MYSYLKSKLDTDDWRVIMQRTFEGHAIHLYKAFYTITTHRIHREYCKNDSTNAQELRRTKPQSNRQTRSTAKLCLRITRNVKRERKTWIALDRTPLPEGNWHNLVQQISNELGIDFSDLFSQIEAFAEVICKKKKDYCVDHRALAEHCCWPSLAERLARDRAALNALIKKEEDNTAGPDEVVSDDTDSLTLYPTVETMASAWHHPAWTRDEQPRMSSSTTETTLSTILSQATTDPQRRRRSSLVALKSFFKRRRSSNPEPKIVHLRRLRGALDEVRDYWFVELHDYRDRYGERRFSYSEKKNVTRQMEQKANEDGRINWSNVN